jgi:hypothetical protein
VTRLRVGTGSSATPEATDAGSHAAATAIGQLQGEQAALIIVYASVRYDLASLVAAIRGVTGDTPLVGATSTGHFQDGDFTVAGEGVVVLAMTAGPYRFGLASVEGLRADAFGAGRTLARNALAAVGPERAPHGALILLADGLAGDQQTLLNGIHRVTGAAIPVVGGAASDDHKLVETFVFHDDRVLTDAAAAVWIASDKPLHVVAGHGWEPVGLPMLVTKQDGTAVHELGGRPAIDVFLEDLRDHDQMAEPGTVRWHTHRAFGLIEPDGTQLIRAAYIDEDDVIQTFSPLPPYAAVQIVSCEQDDLLDVSDDIVKQALDGADAAVILVFSCVASMDILAERACEEAVRLQKAAGGVPTFGFYTYGEFARTTSVAGYHNATVTALAL